MTSKEVNNILATFAVKQAHAIARAELEKNGKKLEPRNGRVLSVASFEEYLASIPLTANIPAALATFLMSPELHAFEIAKASAARRAKEREASDAAIAEAFGTL